MTDHVDGAAAPPDPTGPPRYCLRCFYNLRGLPENRCPECGRFFNPDDPRTYSATPTPERLRNAVKQAATAVSETWRVLNPPAAREPRGLMTPHEWFLEERVRGLQRDNDDLRLYVALLVNRLVANGAMSREQAAQVGEEVREAREARDRQAASPVEDPIEIVDDLDEEEETDDPPSPELLDLGRAAGAPEAGGSETEEGA